MVSSGHGKRITSLSRSGAFYGALIKPIIELLVRKAPPLCGRPKNKLKFIAECLLEGVIIILDGIKIN